MARGPRMIRMIPCAELDGRSLVCGSPQLARTELVNGQISANIAPDYQPVAIGAKKYPIQTKMYFPILYLLCNYDFILLQVPDLEMTSPPRRGGKPAPIGGEVCLSD